MWGHRLDRAGSGQVQVAGACECGNELSGFIKCGEFLDQLKTNWLLKKDSAPWSKKVWTVDNCIKRRAEGLHCYMPGQFHFLSRFGPEYDKSK